MGAISLLVGCGAACAAMGVRRPLIARLGAGWLIRYMVIQAGLINMALLALIMAVGRDWTQGAGAVIFPIAYGVGFFFYSLSNIDWTVKKFHTEGD